MFLNMSMLQRYGLSGTGTIPKWVLFEFTLTLIIHESRIILNKNIYFLCGDELDFIPL